MSQLPSVPVVVVRNNYDFEFSFQDHTYYVPRVSPENLSVNYNQAFFRGHIHAEKVFFLHFLKKGILPQIKIKGLSANNFEYSFAHDFTTFAGCGVDYNDAFAKGVNHLLKVFGVFGVMDL